MAYISSVPAQCGMRFLSNLASVDSLAYQITHLSKALDGYTQVILTDTTSSEKIVWAETKSCCYQGPSTKNPNSGNHVKVYIATSGTLQELIALQKKENKKKKK
jgi:hypothetical protein